MILSNIVSRLSSVMDGFFLTHPHYTAAGSIVQRFFKDPQDLYDYLHLMWEADPTWYVDIEDTQGCFIYYYLLDNNAVPVWAPSPQVWSNTLEVGKIQAEFPDWVVVWQNNLSDVADEHNHVTVIEALNLLEPYLIFIEEMKNN